MRVPHANLVIPQGTDITKRVYFRQNDQLVTLNGTPSSGTFTLTLDDQTTVAIAYNAAASVVQSALEDLSNVGDGNVTVTGSAGGPYTVVFADEVERVREPLEDAGFHPLMVAVETLEPDAAWVQVERKPVDLTGAVIRFHAKEKFSNDTLLLDLSTTNGKITNGGTAGWMDIDFQTADTNAISIRRNRRFVNVGWFNLEMDLSGTVTPILEGQLIISRTAIEV